MTVEIRAAKLEDAYEIGHIHVECWCETYTGIIPQEYLDQISIEKRRDIWREVIGKSQTVFVAIYNDKVVGFANGEKNRYPELKAAGELYAIYLLACHHRQNIGKRLFQAVHDDLSARQLRPLITWVLERNPACGFYEKIGGKVVADKLEKIGGASLREFAFKWD